MKNLFFLSALLFAPQIPASAAPKTAFKAALNPQAMALLDESAAAYAKLQGLSMRINGITRRGEKVTQLSGTLMFSRPDLAKMTLKLNAQERLYLSDGSQVRLQDGPSSFKIRRYRGENALLAVVGDNPLAMNFMLSQLVAGKNPGNQSNPNIQWQRAALLGLSINNITLTMRLKSPGTNPAVPFVTITYQLYFDPKTHLLRRFGAQSRFLYAAETISEVQVNPQFAPDAFAFKPATAPKIAAPASR